MTVLEAIQRSTDFLAKRGVESPRLNAELLLGHVLAMPRMRLYLEFERALTQQQTEVARELVCRRGNREPLQYITGTVSFCGLELTVNPDVLVPRPETELLAERVWKTAVQMVASGTTNPLVCDFGTGSGCIGVAVATHCPTSTVVGADISNRALRVARSNAERHGISARVCLVQAGSLRCLAPAGALSIVVSNPPYIPSDEITKLAPEIRDHEPHSALDGGSDGLEFYRMLAREAAESLRQDGKLMLEFGDQQAEALRRILETENWIVEDVQEDYTCRPRILVARRS